MDNEFKRSDSSFGIMGEWLLYDGPVTKIKSEKPNQTKKQQTNTPYDKLNRWLYDGDATNIYPKELEDDNSLSQINFLYYFMNTPYIIYLSEMFNNYSIYTMNRMTIYKFMKECILLSGYKKPFVNYQKDIKQKITKSLRLKFPFLKNNDINLLIKYIDNSDEKDSIYESLGFYTPKKTKTLKNEKNEIINMKPTNPEKYSLKDLMRNFNND